ncbi:unnamed protein product [Lampetra fluviatilis]
MQLCKHVTRRALWFAHQETFDIEGSVAGQIPVPPTLVFVFPRSCRSRAPSSQPPPQQPWETQPGRLRL